VLQRPRDDDAGSDDPGPHDDAGSDDSHDDAGSHVGLIFKATAASQLAIDPRKQPHVSSEHSDALAL
jgi:hypothetical protein